jgi:hypothetical protein
MRKACNTKHTRAKVFLLPCRANGALREYEPPAAWCYIVEIAKHKIRHYPWPLAACRARAHTFGVGALAPEKRAESAHYKWALRQPASERHRGACHLLAVS